MARINDAIAAGTYTPASKVVAIYGEDTDWGRSFGAGLKHDFTASGWTIKSEDYFPLTQTDFSALMAKYASDDVPVIAGYEHGRGVDHGLHQGLWGVGPQVPRHRRRPWLVRRLVQDDRPGL